jgi:hypothetical protein
MVDEGETAQNEPAAGPVGAGRETQQAQQATPVAGVDAPAAATDPGFLERGGLRRRLRFLRKTRELAYRDLGGLVFEMHRLGQQRQDLLASKLATLQRIDTELRAIEETLQQRHGVTVLREAGVTACPRCAAIHGSEDRFCPACGFSIGGHADRPIGAPPVAQAPPAPAAPTPQQAIVTSPSPPPPPRAPIVVPATPPRPPAAAPTAPASAQPAKPVAPAPQPAAPAAPAAPPREEDQPTQVIEPPTQIVRPNRDAPEDGPNTEKKSKRA